MGILRIYPTQDTSVADHDPSAPALCEPEYANVGAAEILSMWKYGLNRSEVLIQFDSAEVAALPTGSTVYLRLAHAVHSETLPAGYTAMIRPLEQVWTEGDGLDMDTYKDVGAANFWYATTSTTWSLQTGTLSSSFDFVTGKEDLLANVTALTGVMHFGLDVLVNPLMPGSAYIKKFHSRQSHFPSKRPYMEARWADWTGSLTTQTLFCVTSGVFSGTQWPASMASNTEGVSGTLVTSSIVTSDPTGSVLCAMSNLKQVYERTESPRLELVTQLKDWNLATVLTASATYPRAIFTDCYYRVIDLVTHEEVVPFGITPVPYTKLSYTDTGNYFNFDMSTLYPGIFRFDFIYQIGTEWYLIYGSDFKFRVSDLNG